MSYTVKVRIGPKVERLSAGSLDEAVTLAERRLRTAPRRDAVRLPGRHLSPADQVAARAEVSGPEGRGGIDVRGDGSAQAWTGRLRRRPVERRGGEDAHEALARALRG